jgi:hypothetical protein
MRTAASAYVLALTGCVTAATPALDPLGYLPVASVAGCGTAAASDGFTNIVLGQELSAILLRLLPLDEVDVPQCWYKQSEWLIQLQSGPFCEPTALAYFRLVDAEWTLETLDRQPLVLCHERVR